MARFQNRLWWYRPGVVEAGANVAAIEASQVSGEPIQSVRFGISSFLKSARHLTVMALVVLIGGNLLILAASFVMQRWSPQESVPQIHGVNNLAAVDGQVWRGAAPAHDGYTALRAHGVVTVVDLRAEEGVRDDDARLEALGFDVVHLPIRDGQNPTPEQVHTFLDVVADSQGKVFLHCGAGVGRTGAMAAAYLVSTGQISGSGALARNLAMGPPSLEQMAFAVNANRPSATVVAVSRFLDAPRRIWHSLT